ncbi:MAG: NmrA/HSCARG family protein [Acidobacteriaceae bacterium]|nr:NmrA/HSCARG family protein [Acidobacteriaceae bacterium]MBV9222979.1 NmrA/HSCARG family protein [Acidobacteriaceae bacterium]MBV9939599.1 NmrA/HSCARG family protein [Acidobacteriaceae bacterium]
MSNNSQRTILVTGATGQQGGAAYRHLRQRGFKLRALVRDPDSDKARQLMSAGEEVFHGNLDDPDSLSRALDGVHAVYSVQRYTEDVAGEIKQGLALIEAAHRQGVSRFVYSSVGSADEQTGITHFESKGKIEEHLRSSGLDYTIFRPVFFMENWQTIFGAPIQEGRIPLPLSPTTKLQMVAVDDIGAFIALAFEHEGQWRNRTFSLAGDELSMHGIAEALSRAAVKPVQYKQVPWDEFEKQAGHGMTVMFRWFETHGYHVDLEAVKQEYPQTTSFNRWLETYGRAL